MNGDGFSFECCGLHPKSRSKPFDRPLAQTVAQPVEASLQRIVEARLDDVGETVGAPDAQRHKAEHTTIAPCASAVRLGRQGGLGQCYASGEAVHEVEKLDAAAAF